jgi:diguanylate cyclase
VASQRVAEQVRGQLEAAMREPVEAVPGVEPVVLGGSVGLAIYPVDAADPAELIRAADSDMYRRKPATESLF